MAHIVADDAILAALESVHSGSSEWFVVPRFFVLRKFITFIHVGRYLIIPQKLVVYAWKPLQRILVIQLK